MKPLGEAELRAPSRPHRRVACAPPHGVFEGFDQARLISWTRDGSVGHHVEVRASTIGHIARWHIIEVADLPFDPHSSIAITQ